MHTAALPAWLCMEAARGRGMAKEGVALRKVKGRAWKERLSMEGAEEGLVVAEVYECWKEERWQPRGLSQASFVGQSAVETESTEQWDYQATVI